MTEPERPAASGRGPRAWQASRQWLADRRERFAPAWRYLRWPVYVGSGLFALAVLGFVILYLTVDLPDDPPLRESAIVLDAQGRELATLSRDGLRVDVALDDVPPVVVDALIAAEDRRFYDHGGIDPIGVVRAVVNNLTDSDTEGGSTITQQLVRNTYLNQDRTSAAKCARPCWP